MPDIATVMNHLRASASVSKGANKMKRRVYLQSVIRDRSSEMLFVLLSSICCFISFSWNTSSDTTKCICISIDQNIHSVLANGRNEEPASS